MEIGRGTGKVWRNRNHNEVRKRVILCTFYEYVGFVSLGVFCVERVDFRIYTKFDIGVGSQMQTKFVINLTRIYFCLKLFPEKSVIQELMG